MARSGGTKRREARPERTARIAVLAGLPGLVLTGLAALSSTALTLKADLLLTMLDMLVLGAAWIVAARAQARRRRGAEGAQTLLSVLAAASMSASMALVASVAVHRIAAGGVAPEGPGIAFGMALNAVSAAANLWILTRWRRRYRAKPCAVSRSQVCLFSDKLTSNVLIALAMGATLMFEGQAAARYIDPAAGLLIALSTLRWSLPVFRDALHGLALRRATSAAAR
jgi:divalent metal cation (Fe/Co/Zn/Cd) transporter